MGAFEGLTAYLKESLIDYAMQFGYHDSNIAILEGDIDRLRRDHPGIYQNLLTCSHHADRRTPLSYGQDLVASWIFEDLFLANVNKELLNISLAGADRNRMILPDQRTATSTDYIITSNSGYRIGMELVNDYTSFWYRNHKLHLRDNKYLRLLNEQSLLLAIALSHGIAKYTIFDFRDKPAATYIPSHKPYGGKPAYEMPVDRNRLFDFSWESVSRSLTQAVL